MKCITSLPLTYFILFIRYQKAVNDCKLIKERKMLSKFPLKHQMLIHRYKISLIRDTFLIWIPNVSKMICNFLNKYHMFLLHSKLEESLFSICPYLRYFNQVCKILFLAFDKLSMHNFLDLRSSYSQGTSWPLIFIIFKLLFPE